MMPDEFLINHPYWSATFVSLAFLIIYICYKIYQHFKFEVMSEGIEDDNDSRNP